MKTTKTALTIAASASVLLAGCATGPDRKPGDPLEPMNRTMFKVNDAVDRAIAQPIAKGYQKVTPQPLRQAISNFFSNLGDVGNLANNLLQLKITDATQDLMRIAMNTTFGIGGLIDFATAAGLPKHHQDFGLTLGHYGVPSGPYLVLPFFGPSDFRDGTGMIVDVKFGMLGYIEPAWRNPLYVLQFVSARSDLLGATDLLSQAALDKYSFVRDAYMQQRASLLRSSSGPQAPLPDYGDPGDAGAADTEGAGAAAAAGAAGAAATGAIGASAPTAGAAPAGASTPAEGAAAPAAASGASAPASEPAATPAPASGAASTKPATPQPATPSGASAPAPASAPAGQ